MNTETTKLFLNQSYLESGIMLQSAIDNKRTPFWDNVIVTTATNAQAELYKKLISERVERKYLPSTSRFFVEPDREEKRIGSGGSTLCTLVKLLDSCGGDLNKMTAQRNLILHSGGDAKRLPHSAPLGKLFAFSGNHINGDLRNPPGTVFDDLMVSLAGLPSRMNDGVLIVSADAFFRFNHTQIDLNTPDAVAFAMKAPVKEGTIHGVFLENDNNGFVAQFLHKLSEEELLNKGAVSDAGNIDLDIGITYLGVDAIRGLLNLVLNDYGEVDDSKVAQYANESVRLSLYGDMIYPMARESTLESFMEQAADGKLTQELLNLRPILFTELHKIPLRICRFTPGEIRNMGTTEEALETLRFFKKENSLVAGIEQDIRIALATEISKKSIIGENCFVENSHIHDDVQIGENCLISGCDLPEGFRVPANTSLHSVRLKSGKWVCRVWDISDEIKSDSAWLGRPFDKNKWDVRTNSLWNARLFPICDKKETALRWAEKFISGNLTENDMNEWRESDRLSLADTAEMDVFILLDSRSAREDIVRANVFTEKVLHGFAPEEALACLGITQNAARRIKLIENRICNGDYKRWQDAMRLYLCLSEAVERLNLGIDSDNLRENGFAVLRDATAKFNSPSSRKAISAQWITDKAETRLPVRVNWGGTWSDAPPYCFEYGGTMLNAAVSMNSRLPIYARAERLPEPVIEFASIDLKMERRYEKLEPLLSYKDPTDAFILFKAALAIAGILVHENGTLDEQLSRLGGGVRITTEVDVPKGSGLGTSSIIVGALISVLAKLAGNTRSNEEISDDVLLGEQLMTTGGGWQDAIGGMFPGIKLTFTQPGIPQKYDIQPVILSEKAQADLNQRGFLLYTGQRRLARSVLRRVLSNYVCNHHDSLTALEETQRLAVVMVYELRRGNISEFGRLLSEHMRLLRILDASSSNLMLDHIMKGLEVFTDGITLCGAGGGGFLYGILKERVAMGDIQLWLEREYEGTMARLYETTICNKLEFSMRSPKV